MHNSVYLDTPFSYALIAEMHRAGKIKDLVGIGSSYSQRVLAHCHMPEFREAALFNFVLYNKVHINPHIDNFDVKEAAKGEYFSLPEIVNLRPSISDMTYQEIRENGIIFPLLRRLRTKERLTLSARQLGKILEQDFEYTYNELFERNAILLTLTGERRRYKIKWDEGVANLPAALSYANYEEVKELYDLYSKIESHAGEVLRLLHYSNSLQASALTDLRWPRPKAAKKSPVVSREQEALVRVYIKGLRHLKITSFEDAMRMRDSRNIEHFRRELFEMVRAIASGEADMQDVEKRLDSVNRLLDSIGTIGKIGKWATILGVPAIGLSAFIGGPIAIAGFMALIGEVGIKRTYRWALIEN